MQQLADGLTKLQVGQNFAEILRRRWHALKFDPTFTAGKKLTAKQRRCHELEKELRMLQLTARDAREAFGKRLSARLEEVTRMAAPRETSLTFSHLLSPSLTFSHLLR